MNSIAGKLEMIMNLLNSGMLCDCDEWKVFQPKGYEYFDDELEEELVHKENCKGKQRVKELLELKDNE